MSKEKINALGGTIFNMLVANDLSEAEIVEALSIGITLRLAYQTNSFDELLQKLDALHPIFMTHAKTHIEAIAAAQHARKRGIPEDYCSNCMFPKNECVCYG